eukprot:scaffold13221_cov63-Phaeocystis_antarctica.AAC.4
MPHDHGRLKIATLSRAMPVDRAMPLDSCTHSETNNIHIRTAGFVASRGRTVEDPTAGLRWRAL